MPYLGVCYANTPKKRGCMSTLRVDLPTSLRGDFTYTHTRIPGSLNRAKRRSRNRKVVGSIPGAGMSGGGRRQPCVKGILSGEIAK